jgi:hypothetical protein
MKFENHDSSCVHFSERFCRQLRAWWTQLGEDGSHTVAELRPLTSSEGDDQSHSQWGIYFIPIDLPPSYDIMLVEGFPVCIRSIDRGRLAGRQFDFEKGSICLVECEKN